MGDIGGRVQASFEKILVVVVKKIPDMGVALALFFVFLLLALLVSRATRASLARVQADPNISQLVTRLAYYTILLMGLVQALNQLRVNLAALGIGVGAAGFAVGFAVKDILSNFLAGILLLWTRQFVKGDQIRIKDFEGTVESIEMRGTIIRTFDGRRVTIPNADVYTNPLINYTAYPLRRYDISVTVGYDVDIQQVAEIARSALANVPQVATDPIPDVLVKELGNYGMGLQIRIWTPARQLDMLTVSSEAARAIEKAFLENNISMPYPTQEVRLVDPAAGPIR